MSIAADHYEKAAAAGHAGALGEKGFGRGEGMRYCGMRFSTSFNNSAISFPESSL